ncbi:MAG: DUF4911 domain-containing protein [Deltaproteobacteria bacterium]|nr:DUF4911 domain-containing protein [Deltaproteobacteria bacterium]
MRSHEDLHVLRLRIRPQAVYFLRFILEAYDNLYIMTTIDRDCGLVEIRHVTDSEKDLQDILKELTEITGDYQIITRYDTL